MKISCSLVLITLLAISSSARANVGVFTGTGHTIELTSTEKIQMTSEEITIIPGRGPFLFDGTVKGMDRVEYRCVFVLKNLKPEAVKIQVGFPLNSQFLERERAKDRKTKELVASYNFISQIEGHQYTVRFAPGDKHNKFQSLFLWDMNFKPEESKTLQVTYTLPISMSLASSSLKGDIEYKKDWYWRLAECSLEYFGYVTETGKSWSGPIKKAKFRVYLEGFEKYLFQRPMEEGSSEEELKKSKSRCLVWKPTVFRRSQPIAWPKSKGAFLELSYKDYKADQNLQFFYFILPFPQTTKDAESMLHKLSYGFADKGDYEDLRDIMKEFNGVKTENKRIQKFVCNQVWYNEPLQQKIPESVIKAVELKMNSLFKTDSQIKKD